MRLLFAALLLASAITPANVGGNADVCRCGCPRDMHIGEIGCPCGMPDEPPCGEL